MGEHCWESISGTIWFVWIWRHVSPQPLGAPPPTVSSAHTAPPWLAHRSERAPHRANNNLPQPLVHGRLSGQNRDQMNIEKYSDQYKSLYTSLVHQKCRRKQLTQPSTLLPSCCPFSPRRRTNPKTSLTQLVAPSSRAVSCTLTLI